MGKATARAHSNIAFIKYWGNLDDALRLPANSSISMNLESLYTDTTVTWDDSAKQDTLVLNGQPTTGDRLKRVVKHLDCIRERLHITGWAQVSSNNNFPMGAGIASSASAFAALTLAATTAAEKQITERELTTLARLGSGSAARSIPAGYVEWYYGNTHEESFAESIAPPEYWELVDVIAIVSAQHKHTTSQAGHPTAKTSDLQVARVQGAVERLTCCKQAVLDRDFEAFATVVEHDSNLMHAVMMTSSPPLFYWQPATLEIMQLVREWRSAGVAVCYTLDAGPNVHCLCLRSSADTVRKRLLELSEVEDVRTSNPGGPAHLLPDME